MLKARKTPCKISICDLFYANSPTEVLIELSHCGGPRRLAKDATMNEKATLMNIRLVNASPVIVVVPSNDACESTEILSTDEVACHDDAIVTRVGMR